MPTGQTVVNNVLRKLGMLDPGGTPGASDSTYVITELNNQWKIWGVDEGLIYAILASRYSLTAGIGTYTIGTPSSSSLPQPNFKAARPARIYKAVISQATGGAINSNSLFSGGTGYAANDTGVILLGNGTVATYLVNTIGTLGAVATYTLSGAGTGYLPMLGAPTATGGAQAGAGTGFRISIASVTAGGQNRNELRIIEATQYYGHNDLQASGAVPDELYPDYSANQDGFATLYLFPVPLVLAATMLELQAGVAFVDWTLTDNYQLPDGMQDTIEWALAFRCMAGFGSAVSDDAAKVIIAEGPKSEARMRAANSKNRQVPEAEMMAPGSKPAPQGGGQ